MVLFFYPAALTPDCTVESCHFRDLAAEFAELNTQPVGISMDPVSRQKQFADAYGFTYPLLSDLDGAVAVAFGVKPHAEATESSRRTFVIDTNRTILCVIEAEDSMNKHADGALAVLRSRLSS